MAAKKAAKKAATKASKKKTTVKKTPAPKTAAKKAAAKKPASKKPAAKKPAAKKPASKKPAAKAAPKAPAKKAASKKPAAKAAPKAPAKKAASKKPAATSAAVKTPAKKAAGPATSPERKKKSVKSPAVSNQASKAPAKRIAVARRQQVEDIRPYLRKSGEAYMNDAQKSHFRNILLQEKMRLMNEVDRTVTHMKDEAANFPDPADRATQEEEFSLELRTRDRERKLIKKIENTIELIDNDDYGYCETCGVEIGIERLEARPTATKCIDCKTLDEHKEKKELG